MNLTTKKIIFDFVREHNTAVHAPQPEVTERLLSDFIEKAEAGNEMAGIFLAEWLLTDHFSDRVSTKLELFFS